MSRNSDPVRYLPVTVRSKRDNWDVLWLTVILWKA
jgi:hypothetical protein